MPGTDAGGDLTFPCCTTGAYAGSEKRAAGSVARYVRRRLGPSTSYCSRRRERQMSQDQTRVGFSLSPPLFPTHFRATEVRKYGGEGGSERITLSVVLLVESRRGLGLGSSLLHTERGSVEYGVRYFLVFAGKSVLGLVFGWNCGAPGPRVIFHMPPPGKRHGGPLTSHLGPLEFRMTTRRDRKQPSFVLFCHLRSTLLNRE